MQNYFHKLKYKNILLYYEIVFERKGRFVFCEQNKFILPNQITAPSIEPNKNVRNVLHTNNPGAAIK